MKRVIPIDVERQQRLKRRSGSSGSGLKSTSLSISSSGKNTGALRNGMGTIEVRRGEKNDIVVAWFLQSQVQ